MRRRFLLCAASAGLAALAIMATTVGSATAHQRKPAAQHVLLLSVDGLHQSDLAWYVEHHPHSASRGS